MSTGKTAIDYGILKAARVYLRLTQEELAQSAGINVATLVSIETGNAAYESTRQKVVAALERRGIVFSSDEPGFAYRESGATIPK